MLGGSCGYESRSRSRIWLLLDELADFPMMRKCQLGIKRRAETHAATSLRPSLGA